MQTYHYEAVASDGTTLGGSLTAADEPAAARQLRERGLVPVFVGTSPPRRLGRGFRGVRPGRTVQRFTEDMATMLNSGVVLERALSICAETGGSDAESALSRQLLLAVRGGVSFPDALAARPDLFSRLYVSTVRTGEAAGELGPVMEQLAEFERRRERLHGKLVSALSYPALLAVVGTASIAVVLLHVVPRIADSFLSTGFDAPVPMQLLIVASEVVRTWWLVILLLPVATTAVVVAWTRSAQGREVLDRLLLRVPYLGRILGEADTARFARAMSTLLAAAVPLLDSLVAARDVLENTHSRGLVDGVVLGVKRGEGIAGPLARSGAFPVLAHRLLAVGEETGRLPRMFDRLAEIYDRRTTDSLTRFAALLEPLVVLAFGIIIGAIVLSILTAFTSIQRMGL